MGQAPLDREEQIEFIKNFRARRAVAVERWSNSEMHQSAMCDPAQHDVHDSKYSRMNVAGHRCA
jgi:uncharacterized protein YkwD